jgi:hypothetical protein
MCNPHDMEIINAHPVSPNSQVPSTKQNETLPETETKKCSIICSVSTLFVKGDGNSGSEGGCDGPCGVGIHVEAAVGADGDEVYMKKADLLLHN